MNYGFLFFAFFFVFPAHRFARLYFSFYEFIPDKFRAAMGGHFARRTFSARPDFDLHLSKYGLRKHLVCRTLSGDDSCIFRRRSGNK